MLIVGISGSPHANGNTVFALKTALREMETLGFTTQMISLADLTILPCIACWRCQTERTCWQNDDMPGIIQALKSCDGLILASSVQMGMVSGPLKTMMDRCVELRPNYGDPIPLAGKVGFGIACAYSRNGGQETTLQNIHTFLMQMNMLVASDGPPYCHAGATIAGQAATDAWGLETVKNAAHNLARMLGRSK